MSLGLRLVVGVLGPAGAGLDVGRRVRSRVWMEVEVELVVDFDCSLLEHFEARAPDLEWLGARSVDEARRSEWRRLWPWGSRERVGGWR
jgi:hypothetical protein